MCSKMHKTRFIFTLQKCSIICMHGSDYCYPSTSLDQDLELGEDSVRDPTGWRTAPLVSYHCCWSQAQQRAGWGGGTAPGRERLPPRASSHSCASSAPRTVIHALAGVRAVCSVCMSRHQIRPRPPNSQFSVQNELNCQDQSPSTV